MKTIRAESTTKAKGRAGDQKAHCRRLLKMSSTPFSTCLAPTPRQGLGEAERKQCTKYSLPSSFFQLVGKGKLAIQTSSTEGSIRDQ